MTLEQSTFPESAEILTNEEIAQLPESERRRMYEVLLRSLSPPAEKTYWLVTSDNNEEKMTSIIEVSGPIPTKKIFVEKFGQSAIEFMMQLTKEQFDHFLR